MRALFSRGMWGVLIAVLVLLAGCGASAASSPSRQPGVSATPANSTAQATPVTVIGWREVRLPEQVTAHQITGFAVSPVDGQNAWLCVQLSATSLEVWATRDTGAIWSDMGTLPPVTSEQGQSCELAADENDSRTLAAIVSWGLGEAGT